MITNILFKESQKKIKEILQVAKTKETNLTIHLNEKKKISFWRKVRLLRISMPQMLMYCIYQYLFLRSMSILLYLFIYFKLNQEIELLKINNNDSLKAYKDSFGICMEKLTSMMTEFADKNVKLLFKLFILIFKICKYYII